MDDSGAHVAIHLLKWAINWTAQRRQEPFDRPMSHYPQNQFLAAEIGIRAARALLVQTATTIAEAAPTAEPPMMDITACHHFMMETAVSAVDKVMRMVGGAALFRSNPIAC